MFAKFWIMTTNMGPEDVARQIESSGMQIPGFRRDPRILRRVLDRYIPVVAVISGAPWGPLPGGAARTGTSGIPSARGGLSSLGTLSRLTERLGGGRLRGWIPSLGRF